MTDRATLDCTCEYTPKRFNERPQNWSAKVQRELMWLLRESPMPWTFGMIRGWFGWGSSKAPNSFTQAVNMGRITKLERDLYTAGDGRCPAPTPITDEVLARFGFNL